MLRESMMNRFMPVAACLGLCIVLFGNASVAATPFTAKFSVIAVNGDCTIKEKGGAFVKLAQGKSYAYGAQIRTGRKSSCVIAFSKGNECRIFAKTVIVIDENVAKKSAKELDLSKGRVLISLEPDFHKNNELQVQTPTAVCAALGTVFGTEVIVDKNGKVVGTAITCNSGKVKTTGKLFDIPGLGAGTDALIERDGSTEIITVRKGTFVANVAKSFTETKPVTLSEGDRIVIKLERKNNELHVHVEVKYKRGETQKWDFTVKHKLVEPHEAIIEGHSPTPVEVRGP